MARINEAELNRLLYGADGVVHREVVRVARRVQAAARQELRSDTGRLSASIRVVVQSQPSRQRVHARIGTRLDYGWYQEVGTGLYGPEHRLIFPRRAKALRFRPRGGGRVVFAKWVRGSRPQHFMTRGLQRGSPWPVVLHSLTA
ncbi:HK97 gp10 family phage protein [Streptomyces sp. NPDC050095]|uniref:HK97 gp10 family phage protein n=1 Tax=unclassified Streptomyces TaxID=2593676 RepID=UPI00342F6005